MYAKRKGFLVELFTNASLITNGIINVLREYQPLLVVVSLYGADEITYYEITRIKGAFDKVVSNCKKMVEAGIRVFLKSPILSLTVDKINEMKDIVNEKSEFLFFFDIAPTIDKSNQPKNYQVDLKTCLRYELQNYFERIDNGECKICE